jgi:hypothetical protein
MGHGTVDVCLSSEICGVPVSAVPEAIRDGLARDGRAVRRVELGTIVAYEPVTANLVARGPTPSCSR